MTLEHKIGDMFTMLPDKKIIIPHVCNNIGAFGAGFAYAVSRSFPEVREAYIRWFNNGQNEKFKLGATQFVPVNEKIVFANMISQNGTINSTNIKPLRYASLVYCMKAVKECITDEEIHCPRFGSGLAGGNWDFIQELIEEIWVAEGIKVVEYSLE